MLKDSEITQLRENKEYRKVVRVDLKKLGADIVRSGGGEFRTDATFVLKFFHCFAKSRVIRKELITCADGFLCRFLNYELQWPRNPGSIQKICERTDHGFIWMRYDLPHVEALFLLCHDLLTKPEFRNLIKKYSSIADRKNERLIQLTSELGQLKEDTIISIKTRGIYDGLVDLRKSTYYVRNEDHIKEQFLKCSQGGLLGVPNATKGNDDNGE